MPPTTPKIPKMGVLLLGAVLCSGCGDDPELIRKNEQQKAEIRRLEGELQLLREKLDRAPKDRSAELGEMRTNIASEETRIAELETTLGKLETKRRDLEREFKAYQREYPIR